MTNYYLIADYDYKEYKKSSIDELISTLNGKVVGLDTETRPISKKSTFHEIIMLQIGTLQDVFVVDIRQLSVEDLNKLSDFLTTLPLVVGVNLKYDLKMLKFNFSIDIPEIYDAMIVDLVLNAGKSESASLAALAYKYLGLKFPPKITTKNGNKVKAIQGVLFEEFNLSKDTRKEFADIGDSPFTKAQIYYGIFDVLIPLAVRNKQLKLIEEYGMNNVVSLENNFVKVLAEMEFNGMHIDTDILDEEIQRVSVQADNLHKQLLEVADINWNSPKQVQEVFKEHGIPTVFKVDGVEKVSVGKVHLKKYKDQYPLVKLYLQYKQLQKLVSSFGKNLVDLIDEQTGCLHSDYWQLVVTGRQSSRAPNLQNIPRDNEYCAIRKSFTPREEYSLIVADYSSQESRVLADKSNEKQMQEFINQGGDIHRFVASKIFNKAPEDISPLERQRAKTINFAIVYGSGAKNIAENLGITTKEAQDLMNAFFVAFPHLKSYFTEITERTLNNGYIQIDSYTNRRVWLPPEEYKQFIFCHKFITDYVSKGWKTYIPRKISSTYSKLKSKFGRLSQNYPIQGTSASMTKLALVNFYNTIKNKNLDVLLVNVVHDEIIIECNSNIKDKALKLLKNSMEESARVLLNSVECPAEPVLVEYWNH